MLENPNQIIENVDTLEELEQAGSLSRIFAEQEADFSLDEERDFFRSYHGFELVMDDKRTMYDASEASFRAYKKIGSIRQGIGFVQVEAAKWLRRVLAVYPPGFLADCRLKQFRLAAELSYRSPDLWVGERKMAGLAHSNGSIIVRGIDPKTVHHEVYHMKAFADAEFASRVYSRWSRITPPEDYIGKEYYKLSPEELMGPRPAGMVRHYGLRSHGEDQADVWAEDATVVHRAASIFDEDSILRQKRDLLREEMGYRSMELMCRPYFMDRALGKVDEEYWQFGSKIEQ